MEELNFLQSRLMYVDHSPSIFCQHLLSLGLDYYLFGFVVRCGPQTVRELFLIVVNEPDFLALEERLTHLGC